MDHLIRFAVGPLLACALGVACSTVSGLDDLRFDLRDAAGGSGGAAVTTSEGGGGPGGGPGSGGQGGGCPICDAPPDDCHEPVGTCSGGECVYALKTAGTLCDDDDACTVGDACDDLGNCVPGPVCPSTDPCKIVACVGGACETSDEKTGKSCGATAAKRCCGGTCVDISSDEGNCGGCGSSCKGSEMCESVDATASCELAPATTSGRCTCAANADCPLGQVCRTVQPFTNRCSPDAAANCDGTFTNVNLCPNFCSY